MNFLKFNIKIDPGEKMLGRRVGARRTRVEPSAATITKNPARTTACDSLGRAGRGSTTAAGTVRDGLSMGMGGAG